MTHFERVKPSTAGSRRVADRNVVYLYDVRGTRFAKLRLKNGLAMDEHKRAA
jgi:hypothetical protein